MADSKVQKNTLDLGIVLWMTVSEVLVELGIVEVNIRNFFSVVMIHVKTHLDTIVSYKS